MNFSRVFPTHLLKNISKPLLKVWMMNIFQNNTVTWGLGREHLRQLPEITPDTSDFDSPAIKIGSSNQLDSEARSNLFHVLKKFMPWRKGPWSLFGIHIDTEWQSNMKWDRIRKSISSLKDRLILDVGCGNSYYGFRMLTQEPAYILGIDPTQLFLLQYKIFKNYLPTIPLVQLPLKDDALPTSMHCFDTVFSLGVLYHRRDPMQHLSLLRAAMRTGAELVLESLVIESEINDVLIPNGGYAKMRNVWNIPSCLTLTNWLAKAGFEDIRIIDVTKTNTNEQRVTPWMEFESLQDFLDPDNSDLTIEGHPAPLRAIIIATAK